MNEPNLNTICTELKITPNKRKRDDTKERKLQQLNNHGSNKENNFIYNNFMEVKSIAELVEVKKHQNSNLIDGENPFEVVRKPPKKKNRKNFTDEGCFVNPALNLNGPEKILNPFEVKRTASLPEAVHHCFENTGLNIRVEDRQLNPFEVARQNVQENPKGVVNPGLDVRTAPLVIGLPFTPTVGCRIDFKNINIEDLTPNSMLNRHLVLSTAEKFDESTPKRPNLSIISEEAVDISKELEGYQLEIENSMNEAKATNIRDDGIQLDSKPKNSYTKQLRKSSSGNKQKVSNVAVEPNLVVQATLMNTEEHSCHDTSDGPNDCPKSSTPKTPNENCIAKYSLERSFDINENPDVVYEEVNDSQTSNEIRNNKQNDVAEEEVFKNPAPFVRVYRRDVQKKSIIRPNQAASEATMKFYEKEKDTHEILSGIRSSIRKSFRKLINPTASKCSTEASPNKEQPIPTNSNNILTSIRHSLRKKQPKQPLATPRQSLNEISIIDTSEPRNIYKDNPFSARENHTHENLLRSKNNLRSSFRRSKLAVKSVFKKNTEDYEIRK